MYAGGEGVLRCSVSPPCPHSHWATHACLRAHPPRHLVRCGSLLSDTDHTRTPLLVQVKVLRDPERPDPSGNPAGKSRGFGFVEFSDHTHALAGAHARG